VVVIKGPRSWTKDDAIRTALVESPAEYHHRLGRILDDPDAAEFAPMLVRRVRRQRARRLARRSGRRLAGWPDREPRELLPFDPDPA
jgi:hypothetical protein